MMKKRLGMQQELAMAPIPKVMVSVGQFRPAREFGESICVFCLKDGDAKNEFRNGMTGLCVHDSGIAANLNRKKGQRNDDANCPDHLGDCCNGFPVHRVILVTPSETQDQRPREREMTFACSLI